MTTKRPPKALRNVEKRCAYCSSARGTHVAVHDGPRGWHWAHTACRRSYVGAQWAKNPTPAQQRARDDFARWQRETAVRKMLERMVATRGPSRDTLIPECFRDVVEDDRHTPTTMETHGALWKTLRMFPRI